ncbi:ty3-gypsy retrotransposon protein [Cucumis melo var. makuwa]|uniref:Ty3-gypsy retrotransposon protein n=1 Tax=Cucumis melo var. makuwa TaxID=1194695 RepID=A0A5D3BMP8_CUCMM|nr:ty3-gypsy retrotransposon protein [Cucumis melo var. makuwa]
MTKTHMVESMGLVHGSTRPKSIKNPPEKSINRGVLFICTGEKFFTPEGPVTCNRSKRIIQEQDQGSTITQSILKQLMESLKGRIIIRENPLFEISTYVSDSSEQELHLKVVSVMMTDVIAEATMANIERKINFLMKAIEERDHEIAALKDQMKVCETAKSSKTPVVKADDKGKVVLQEIQTQ